MTTAVVDIAVDTTRTAGPTTLRPAARASAGHRFSPPRTGPLHVATPDAALAAFASGSSAICLTPFTGSVALARQLLDAADAAGVVGVVPFVARYHPMAQVARERVSRGELGMLLSFTGTYLQDALLGADDPGGTAAGSSRAFAQLGSQLCDLLEFVSGHRITRVTARTRRVFDRRGGVAVVGEDIATVLVETDGGALGTVVVSQMAAGHPDTMTLSLHGTAGSVGVTREQPGRRWLGAAGESSTGPESRTDASADLAFDAYLTAAEAVDDTLRPRDLPTLRDGLRAATIAAAVIESAASGTWVETPYAAA